MEVSRRLEGKRLLVVEDEPLIAAELVKGLTQCGAAIAAVAGTVDLAFRAAEREPDLDGAVLDVNLWGEPVFPVAELLGRKQIPYVFVTGYPAASLPPSYASQQVCSKPVDMTHLVGLLAVLMPMHPKHGLA
jgi:CheY-like chemotaxis protein